MNDIQIRSKEKPPTPKYPRYHVRHSILEMVSADETDPPNESLEAVWPKLCDLQVDFFTDESVRKWHRCVVDNDSELQPTQKEKMKRWLKRATYVLVGVPAALLSFGSLIVFLAGIGHRIEVSQETLRWIIGISAIVAIVTLSLLWLDEPWVRRRKSTKWKYEEMDEYTCALVNGHQRKVPSEVEAIIACMRSIAPTAVIMVESHKRQHMLAFRFHSVANGKAAHLRLWEWCDRPLVS